MSENKCSYMQCCVYIVINKSALECVQLNEELVRNQLFILGCLTWFASHTYIHTACVAQCIKVFWSTAEMLDSYWINSRKSSLPGKLRIRKWMEQWIGQDAGLLHDVWRRCLKSVSPWQHVLRENTQIPEVSFYIYLLLYLNYIILYFFF